MQTAYIYWQNVHGQETLLKKTGHPILNISVYVTRYLEMRNEFLKRELTKRVLNSSMKTITNILEAIFISTQWNVILTMKLQLSPNFDSKFLCLFIIDL